MRFLRQEYGSRLPFPFPGDLPNPGIKPRSPALQADSTTEPPRKPRLSLVLLLIGFCVLSTIDFQEINPEHSLERLMLKLKLLYFGHLMWRTDSLGKTLMLGKIADRRRWGQQRTRWLDGSTDLMDMSPSKLQEIEKDREPWWAAVHRITKSRTGLSDWTTTVCPLWGPDNLYCFMVPSALFIVIVDLVTWICHHGDCASVNRPRDSSGERSNFLTLAGLHWCSLNLLRSWPLG